MAQGNQVYESYWNYTAALTNFNGLKFRNVLSKSLDFLDNCSSSDYSPEKYTQMQEFINRYEPTKNMASQRKRINQLVKLGFIKPFLSGYPPESQDFLKASSDFQRRSILSKIVYKYANLCNATTVDQGAHQFSFFMKTLEEIGSFNYKELATIMTVDVNRFPAGYLTKDQLDNHYRTTDVSGFVSRKYNQVSHLQNILGKLDDIIKEGEILCFATNAEEVYGSSDGGKKQYRDPYLQRVYKKELEDESRVAFQSRDAKCMLEGIAHPVLIASHIKPYKKSEESEAFDVNNGLLLNKNFDSLFDLGYITFDEKGTIIPSPVLSSELRCCLSHYHLRPEFINESRMKYMAYHRENVFEKRYAKKKPTALRSSQED